MIKAEKGTVRMEGCSVVLEVELIAVIKGFYQALVRGYGEEFADKRMDFILEKALDSDEAEAETILELKTKDALRKTFEIIKEMEGEK